MARSAADPDGRCRVLFVTPWYPVPESPAAGVFVQEHARAVALFDDVAVVHLHADTTRRGGSIELEPVPDERFPVIRARYGPIRYASWLVELTALAKAVGALGERGFRPAVIHGHVAPNAAPAALYSRAARLPLVLTEHWTTYLDADPHPLRGVSALFARLALKRAVRVLPVSSALERAMQRFAPHASYEVIPNVIDCELFRPATVRPPTDPVQLIAVGLLSPQKDYPTMVRAMRLLVDAELPVRLEIVGYGDCHSHIARQIERSRLQNHVELVGYLPKAEVAEHVRRSHVFVHSSQFETFCAAAAEALASGIPVVSTRCGGPEDYLTPEVGRLVPLDGPGPLAAGIRDVIDRLDSFQPERIAAYARQQFAADVVGERLHSVYTSIPG